MQKLQKREITREQYMRAVQNHGYLTKEDLESVFTDSERLGYGLYDSRCFEEDEKFFVWYRLGSSCD